MASIAPTKGNLLAEKKKLELARSGYELLDKKRNILLRELLKYEKEAEELKKKTGDVFAAAAILRGRGDAEGAATLLSRLAASRLPGAEEAARLLK